MARIARRSPRGLAGLVALHGLDQPIEALLAAMTQVRSEPRRKGRAVPEVFVSCGSVGSQMLRNQMRELEVDWARQPLPLGGGGGLVGIFRTHRWVRLFRDPPRCGPLPNFPSRLWRVGPRCLDKFLVMRLAII